ncbi:MAG: alpha-hydroxy-acid oxidizing protein, partial [Proteobacteria bacterium]|nr:alpha-hydroxy-acid oxidizing protein [Pseudomonadota bacterium]
GFRRESGRDRIDWDFLSELRTRWKGNLVLKGVMSCEDAKRATAANVDAVYVSNHGGRQLESAPAAISRLSKIRTVLGDDTSVLFDSGVRNGDDVARALATGADFVMLGRPILYALAGRGERGLNEFLRLLIDEFSIVMAQLGCTEPAQINHECIASKD